jgi:hypothetical protein
VTEDIIKLLPGIGVTGLLLFAILAGQRRLWVWARELDECKKDCAERAAEYKALADARVTEMKAERDRWEQMYWRQAGVIDRTIDLARGK